MPEPDRTQPQSMALAISNEMVQLFSRYTGRGPTKARTVVNSSLAVVAFQDTLTKGEQNLVAAGQVDAVYTMRRTFHLVMREEAASTVSRILGRRVVACLCDVDPNANVAAMVFMLDEAGSRDGNQPG
jgi:uncharacterized protein YbcI